MMTAAGISIIVFVAITLAIGLRTYAKIRGQARNYYVAGNAMPVWVIGITLCAQAFDANGSIGNASASFARGFWAGALYPVGLALCLLLTGLFYARPIHRMRLMTLPDFYRRRYSPTTETLAVFAMLASNIILVAGNLAGLGLLLDRVFGAGYLWMLVAIALAILAYAVTGGLYATIATSVFQVAVFVTGTLLGFGWFIASHGWANLLEPVPAAFRDMSGLLSMEHGALANWGPLLALGLGDIVAIDFIQRVISADSGKSAQRGCYIAGGITLVVGTAVSFMGLFAFYFEAKPSSDLLVNLSLEHLPTTIGILILLGIIAASMSTAAGVVLDLANVITRNLLQRYSTRKWNDESLLRISRTMALPTMAFAVAFAYVRPEPGVLLILAFDVVLAGCFVPLTLGLFWSKSNTPGALASITVGSAARVAAHFLTPEKWVGLDTLVPPLISLVAFVAVSLATQDGSPPRHEALEYEPTDDELVTGAV